MIRVSHTAPTTPTRRRTPDCSASTVLASGGPSEARESALCGLVKREASRPPSPRWSTGGRAATGPPRHRRHTAPGRPHSGDPPRTARSTGRERNGKPKKRETDHHPLGARRSSILLHIERRFATRGCPHVPSVGHRPRRLARMPARNTATHPHAISHVAHRSTPPTRPPPASHAPLTTPLRPLGAPRTAVNAPANGTR